MINDFLGKETAVGDYFAYPLIIGRSANMAIFQLTEILSDGRVKARPVTRAYGFNDNMKYRIFDYNAEGGGKWCYRDMTEKERAKVDAKRSTLQMFGERAVRIPADPRFE